MGNCVTCSSWFTNQCQVCLNEASQQQFVTFCECCQSSCISCTLSYINQEINNFRLPACLKGSKLKQESGFLNFLTQPMKIKYEKRKSYSKSYCKKQCRAGIIIQVEGSPQKYACSVCSTRYCHLCKQYYHQGSCENIALLNLIQQFEYSICGSCHRTVERVTGCNHITCICQNEFCYFCWDHFQPDHLCDTFMKQSRTKTIIRLKKEIQQAKQKADLRKQQEKKEKLDSAQEVIKFIEMNSEIRKIEQIQQENKHPRVFFITKLFSITKDILQITVFRRHMLINSIISKVLLVLYSIAILPLALFFLLALYLLYFSLFITVGVVLFCWVAFMAQFSSCKPKPISNKSMMILYYIIKILLTISLVYSVYYIWGLYKIIKEGYFCKEFEDVLYMRKTWFMSYLQNSQF